MFFINYIIVIDFVGNISRFVGNSFHRYSYGLKAYFQV